jgi:TPR repeat protein
MPKRLAFVCILLSVFSGGASATAQEVPLTDCDKYAASDQDALRKGPGVPFAQVDENLAIPACEAAVRQYPKSTRLIYQLGRAYHKANKLDAAIRHYREAAKEGYTAAENNLGAMFVNGLGVTRDYPEALTWFRKAANKGFAAAQRNIGYMYENGQGVEQDYKQAIAWYRKAAEQGYAPAQYSIGLMYENGFGVPKSKETALDWFGQAAKSGLKEAMEKLSTVQAGPSTCGAAQPGPGFSVSGGKYEITTDSFDVGTDAKMAI